VRAAARRETEHGEIKKATSDDIRSSVHSCEGKLLQYTAAAAAARHSG
jgi:hypothetical protein